MVERKKGARVGAFCLAGMLFLSGCAQRSGKIRRPSESQRSTATDATRETEPETYATETTVPMPRQTDATEQGQLVYGDSRIPHYSGTDPDWKTFRFKWKCQNKINTAWVDVQLDANMYEHYKSLDRYYSVDEYYKYVVDENNRKLVQGIVKTMRELAAELHYDDGAVAREIANFVQQCIEYQYDSDTTDRDEYPRYPIETLYEHQGDCEDTSILMAALLREYGYEVGFFEFPGHAAVAIRASDDYNDGDYFQYGDHRYLYIESTATGWEIGDVPEEFKNTAGKLYLIP